MRNIWVMMMLVMAAALSGCNGGGSASTNGGSTSLADFKFDTIAGKMTYSVEVEPLDTAGYCYTVSVNGKAFIRQTVIPVIEGYHCFRTAQDAFNTGRLVAKKLAETSDLPALTREDLVSLGILTKDGKLIEKK